MITIDNPTLPALYDRILDLRTQVHKEFMAREAIRTSEEYTKLEQVIADYQDRILTLKDQQVKLLGENPDSSVALQEVEAELFELMKAEGKNQFGNAMMKYSESNTVNKSRLLERAGGDLDLILDLATFTIKGVKEYAKSSRDNSFLDCIETTLTPSGINFKDA